MTAILGSAVAEVAALTIDARAACWPRHWTAPRMT